jgi:DNA polymerase III subunit delta
MPAVPIVYIFHGEDQEAKLEAMATLQSKLGGESAAQLNTTILGEQSLNFDELRNACFAAPFLAERRLVSLHSASKHFIAAEQKEKFIQFLNDLPESTGLVLIENDPLEGKHWLVKWARSAGSRAFVKEFALPKGAQMISWIRERAGQLGVEINHQAATALEDLVGNDKGAAQNEIEKLAAYAGYSRTIEASDVEYVSLPTGEQGDFFALIDAIGAGNPSRAMRNLRELLAERDHMFLFFSLVGHFRLLLQSRELVDDGHADTAVANTLKIHPYRAQRLTSQARRFSMESLGKIYARLLELDELVKTGKMDWDLAIESLIAGLSAQSA